MKRSLTERANRRRGASAIEFALILPVFIAIFGAIIELSNYVSMFHRVTRAARDAARIGSTVIEGVDPDGTEIIAEANTHAAFVLDEAGYPCDTAVGCSVDSIWEQDADDGFYYLTVTIDYPYSGLTGIMPALTDRGLVASFTMMTQQQ